MAESPTPTPTPTPLHFIHFVRPLRLAGKASKSSLYCTRRAQRLGLLSHFLDVPLDSGGGFVGIDANISIKQLLGTTKQSTPLFLVNPVDLNMMCVTTWIKYLRCGLWDFGPEHELATWLDKERDDPLDLCESFPWLWPLSLSSPSSSQPTKVGLPKERESKKKSRCVYGRVKLVEPGGFRPKIDSLQAAKAGNYWPGGESGKQHTHYTWRLLARHWTPERRCKLPAAPLFFVCVVRNLECH